MPRTRGRARSEEAPTEENESFEMEQDDPRGGRKRRRNVEGFVEGRQDAARSNRGTRSDDDDYSGPSTVSSGWGAVKKYKAATSGYPDQFKATDEEKLVAFIEDEPFTAYLEHWVNEMPKGQKKSFVCLGDGCPLCAIGHKPRSIAVFNIVDFTDPQNPELKVWQAGPGPLGKIEQRADNSRTSPINKDGLYFAVSSVQGSNGYYQYTVDPVRADALAEDFGIDPDFAADAIDRLSEKVYDKSIVRVDSRETLQEIADSLD